MKNYLLPIKPIKQKTLLHCGPACLQLILNYYGFSNINQSIIGRDLKVRQRRGCYDQDIINYLKRYNIESIKSKHIEDLEKINRGYPIILSQEDHVMLCVGVEGDKYVFIDTEFGSVRKRKLDWFKKNVIDLLIVTKVGLKEYAI